MEENKKEYQVIGTVTIGTDEYRDLIEAVKDAQRDASEERSRWCEQYSRANKFENENKELLAKLEKYEAFIKQDTVKDKFALFLVTFNE